MQEYIRKMITERDDLKGKISRVKKAIENPPYGADKTSIELLELQLEPMQKYLAILDKRIEHESK